MTSNVIIRPLQYRDLAAVCQITPPLGSDSDRSLAAFHEYLQFLNNWYFPMKCLSWFPNPCQRTMCVYVAEQDQEIKGVIKVSPFNKSRSTWQVEHVIVAPDVDQGEVGSALLRYCFESIIEARTWFIEVNIHNQSALSLYRLNGFQPLANMTYWSISPELTVLLAKADTSVPNLLPVSNVDAQMLYQLDTVSMPPLVRQVFDRHPQDFQVSLWHRFLRLAKNWHQGRQAFSGYVFEPQRKAAIGYFYLNIDPQGKTCAELTVHPAYTWLYPLLIGQMSKIICEFPQQNWQLASADYQPEREEHLTKLGADRVEHTLLMSRSVWHKVKETRSVNLEVLQLSEMLQSLQPRQNPIPNRILRCQDQPKNTSNQKN